MAGSRRKPTQWLGLDLGAQSLKLLLVERAPGGPRLVKHLIQELPAAGSPQAVDRVGWLQSALKEFETTEVHLAFSGPEVAVRRLQMPPMSARELAEAVKWQVKDQLPFPVQDALLSTRALGEVRDKDLKKQDLLVAAASRAKVQEAVALVERAGGRVASVSPASAALWQGAVSLVPELARGAAAVVEIGATGTRAVILKDGQWCVERDLAIGSSHLTQALVGMVASERGEISIDAAKAEALARRYGVLTETAQGATEEGVPLFHLASLMRPVLESLLTELSRFFDFYKVQMDAAGVSRVLLCGGGATFKSLQSYLADGLGLPVELFSPLEGGPRLAVALGAALDHGQTFNLLPSQARRQWMPELSARAGRKVVRTLLAVLVVAYLGLQGFGVLLDRQLRQRQAEWDVLAPAYERHQRLVTAHHRLEQRAALIRRFLDAQPAWDGVLKELGRLTPATIQLDEVSAGADEGAGKSFPFTLKGTVSGAGPDEGGIAEYLEALEASPFFERVELTSSETRAGGAQAATFELDGVLE